jgi:hypothetical protein
VMGHLVIGLALFDTLPRQHGAEVRFAPVHAGVHFNLARDWERHACLVMPSSCASEPCSAADLPAHAISHASAVSTLGPWQPKATFDKDTGLLNAGRGSTLAASCETNYFFCRPPSERCAAVDAERLAMDRTAPRSLFLACARAAPACADFLTAAPPRLSACAASLLRMYMHVHRRAGVVPANTSYFRQMPTVSPHSVAAAAGEAVDSRAEESSLRSLRSRIAFLLAQSEVRGEAPVSPLTVETVSAADWASPTCLGARARSGPEGTLGTSTVVGYAGVPPGITRGLPSVLHADGTLAPSIHGTRNDSWGDCARGDRGGWFGSPTHLKGQDIVRDCAIRCQSCARCSVMSASPSRALCLWQYAQCPPRGELDVSTRFESFTTLPRRALRLLLPT